MTEQEKQKYYGNEAFETIYEKAKKDYAQELASYTPLDEKTLAARIGAALRPLYERAIASVFRGNRRANAELDADALSRGMGGSTSGLELWLSMRMFTSLDRRRRRLVVPRASQARPRPSRQMPASRHML